MTPLPVHLLACKYVIFQEGHEEVAAATSVSKLQRYLCRPEEPVFYQLQYFDYYEQFVVGAGQPWTSSTPAAAISSTSSCHNSPMSFKEARTIDSTVYNTYHDAAQAFGLLHGDSEDQLCFNELRDSGYLASPVDMANLAKEACIPTYRDDLEHLSPGHLQPSRDDGMKP